ERKRTWPRTLRLGGRAGGRRMSVVHSHHDGNESRLFGADRLLDPFAGIALACVEKGCTGSSLADDADLVRFRIRLLETIGQPFGHGIAEDDPGFGGRDLRLLRRRGTGHIGGSLVLTVFTRPRRSPFGRRAGIEKPWI